MKQIEIVNSRITVLNGGFKKSRGEKDATIRMKDLPQDTSFKVSAGYTGAKIINLRNKKAAGE
jgi:hypothetical protein